MFLAAVEHQPPAADVALAARRIDRVVDRRRDVGRAVVLVLHVERQPGEVDGVAGDDHLLHRRVALRNLDRPLRRLHPARELARQRALVRQRKGRGVTAAAAADRADDLEPLRAGILEQGRLG